MKSSLNSGKKSLGEMSKKTTIFLLILLMLSSFLFTPFSPVQAQNVDPAASVQRQAAAIKLTLWQKISKLLLKVGATSFQTVARTALNKIAYDTANYLGAGDKGQKPLFITQDWGAYLGQIGDEAAGQFIETFATNLAETSSSDSVKSKECQNGYQECATKCLKFKAPSGGNGVDCGKIENPDGSFTDLGACSVSTPGKSCQQTCQETALACDKGVSNSNSGITVGMKSVNICQPSSLAAKVKIGLGLVQQQRPGTPNCTATEMVNNWGDEKDRYANMFNDSQKPDFLYKLANFFDPTTNDLGIYITTQEGLNSSQKIMDENTKLNLAANKGWLNKTNIAKNLIGVPGDAEAKRDAAGNLMDANFGKVTGDIVVDAANVFLNQVAISGFKTLMSNLNDKIKKNSLPDPTDKNSDYSIAYGEGNVKEVSSSIIKPDFGVRADYNILSKLAVCPDLKNPGPTDCVIDDKFVQAITEKKTVAEAVTQGYINGSWLISKDTIESTYSLRNISILRKYRILPIGWEEAVTRAFSKPNNVKRVTVMDLVSCFNPTDIYNQFSSDFDLHDQSWCRGLVDPNWVLKAPLNSCLSEGNGGQILNKMVTPSIPGLNGNPYAPSALNVTRAEDYCADEQTCIKEKSDGSCEVYGYCNEEKRTWNFASDTCEPIYNTCQSFTNPTTGKNVSYLENTLNYEGCSPESAGCRLYSNYGAYSTSTGAVNWQASRSNYFNKNLTACNSKDEGCTELLRVKPTWGSNLLMDSDFNTEEIGASSTTSKLNSWPIWSSNAINRRVTIVDSSVNPGGGTGKAMKIVATRSGAAYAVVGIYSDISNQLLPDNFQVIPGQAYTFSADVYLAQGHLAHAYIGSSADGFVQSTGILNGWQKLSVTRIADGSFNEPVFGINIDGPTNIEVYVKNLKFEVSEYATGYNIYGAYKVYEKIIPPYLEAACYNDVGSATKDYRLRNDAPAECAKFARKCNQAEVGCESFTNVKSGIKVSAQVTSSDYCPNECLGYDIYISKEDYFNSPQSENLLPQTAKTCSAEAVGCSEFTNLDALNQGGENKEYYSALKQCIKPSTTQCASFYSWEGTDTGYQLRAYSLQKDAVGAPKVTASDSLVCNAAIYNKTLGDPAYNADCREFYNAAGAISYHLLSRTITCSENCHPYRRSDKNVDKTLTQAQCNANPTNPVNRYWDASINSCYVCANGGAWDNSAKACIYQAIPGEGRSCSASENGCREYNGSDGHNVKMLSFYDFENGAQSWNSNCSSGLQLTTISNNKDGHSLLYKNGASNCSAIGTEAQNSVVKLPLVNQVFATAGVAAQLKVSSLVTTGKSYSLRFIARAATDVNPTIYFSNAEAVNPQRSYFATSTLTIKGGGEWKIYQTNLDNLDHAITPNEILAISANGDFYFDEVVLTEITDRYYLIKESSQIPDICYYDMADKYQGADYNLGCSQYLDRGNLKHNLRKFSKLCSDSAIGCEQMIATQNYSPYGLGIWNDTNKNGICDATEKDCTTVAGDKAIYAVYDSSKQCNSVDIGCSRLGQGTANSSSWQDVYKKNNPNLYDKILCSQDALGCEEWTDNEGILNYFRDPGNETCQYRASQDLTIPGKAWYKIPVKRCDIDGDGEIKGTEKNTKVCNLSDDCLGKPCIIDNNDYICSNSYLKTFGLGGAGNQVPVPDAQAGLCESTASGCSEYIDPVSKYAPNLIYNPSYENSTNGYEGWGPNPDIKWQGRNLAANEQVVKIEANKLYVFSTRNNKSNTPTRLSFLTGIKVLQTDNNLNPISTTTITIPGLPALPVLVNQNIIFYSLNNSSVLVTGGAGGATGKIIELKTSIINYQLQTNIDRKSCNGAVNLDNGCVLFNERSVGSTGLASLSGKWDAQVTLDKQAPAACNVSYPGSCTANQLIKVSPNRTCAKWLDCLTYTQDPITKERSCFAVGECSRLNEKNECANFEDISTSTSSTLYSSTGQNMNATGYYLLDKYHLSNMTEVGLNSDAHYDFEDNVPALSCKRSDTSADCLFSKNIVTDLLVREPEKTPTGTDYPAHGVSFLRVPAPYLVSPQSKNSSVAVAINSDYYVNFLVNTKNSGLGATIRIVKLANNAETLIGTVKTFSSNNGWSRQVFSFNSGDATAIKIYLGTDNINSDGEVYFDDINIEPVLEISNVGGKKEYVARECRLYPTSDSLTCVNKNNNVLKDGWEGYCLQHDPNNAAVCQMWYPVDTVSSAQTTRNASGYQGKFPLNYCTEVNGNFDLVEKRVVVQVDADWSNKNNGPGNSCNKVASDCNGDTNYDKYVEVHDGDVSIWWHTFCVPKKDNLLIYKETLLNTEDGICAEAGVKSVEGWGVYDGLKFWRSGSTNGCNHGTCFDLNEEGNADPAVRVYDYKRIPADEDGLKLISGTDTDKIFRLTCNNFIQTVDYNGDNQAWAVRTGINSIWATTTPPYFIDNTLIGLKFFGDPPIKNILGIPESLHYLSAYGRNRQDTPFGAAAWPGSYNLLSSEAIKLRDQFSLKNKEDVFAGRPYGCSNYNGEPGTGCHSIGYCSLDPSVYCLVGNDSSTDFVSRKTCGDGGFGTCVELWSDYYLGNPALNANNGRDFNTILKNLFLKSYNSFTFNGDSYTSGGLDINPTATSFPTCPLVTGRPVASYSSVASSSASYCAVWPIIPATIKVTSNNKVIASSTTVYIGEKGVYGLEFNSIIDPEQQPLKEIYIDWGLGENKQLITGQDSRPATSSPHVFYHYYKTKGTKIIKIKITDNWGKFGER